MLGGHHHVFHAGALGKIGPGACGVRFRIELLCKLLVFGDRNSFLFHGPLMPAELAVEPEMYEHAEPSFVPPFIRRSRSPPSTWSGRWTQRLQRAKARRSTKVRLRRRTNLRGPDEKSHGVIASQVCPYFYHLLGIAATAKAAGSDQNKNSMRAVAPRGWPMAVSEKQTCEINDVQSIGGIDQIGLHLNGTTFVLPKHVPPEKFSENDGRTRLRSKFTRLRIRGSYSEGESLPVISSNSSRKSAAICGTAGQPHSLRHLVPKSGGSGVSLILRNRKAGTPSQQFGRFGSQEQATRNRQKTGAGSIAITQGTRQRPPVCDIQPDFETVDNSTGESDRKPTPVFSNTSSSAKSETARRNAFTFSRT